MHRLVKWLFLAICLVVMVIVHLLWTMPKSPALCVRKENTLSRIDNPSVPGKPDNAEEEDWQRTSRADGQWTIVKMLVNGEQVVQAVQRNRKRTENENNYFVPFSFVKKYFDMPGHLQPSEDGLGLTWTHSHGRIFEPKGEHNFRNAYLNFENSSVEARGRLQCIDGVWEVPRSRRHKAKGYFYPIQIAQYGLRHYSLFLSRGESADILLLEDGSGKSSGGKSKWSCWPSNCQVTWDYTHGDAIIEGALKFHTENFGAKRAAHDAPALVMKVPKDKGHTLGVFTAMMKFDVEQSEVAVEMVNLLQGISYTVHYTSSSIGPDDKPIQCTKNSFRYNIGPRTAHWSMITRQLHVDLRKAVDFCSPSRARLRQQTVELPHVVVSKVFVRGSGKLARLTLQASGHKQMALRVADWLVSHQDKDGGWPISIERTISSGRSPLGRPSVIARLKPGWKSAMAQGQAMSLLVRAFHLTKNKSYLQAALKATHPFTVSSTNGGVRALFMDRYPWYEEYPSSPPLFVLNGFMFSLIGLADLAQAANSVGSHSQAQKLFNEGLASLEAMINLFDTGSGTVYDLRHFTSKSGAPVVVRAEYHVTHINLLAALSTTAPQKKFLTVVHDRWLSYHHGKRVRQDEYAKS